MSPLMIDYIAVLALGGLIGFVEILSRYKDAPFKVSFYLPGLFYLLINALAAASALWAVRLFGWSIGDNTTLTPEMIRWIQVLAAGLGAMAIFRSSFFMFRIGEQDISIGPNAILQILLVAIDKEVDRMRGQQRARVVEDAMEGISFKDAATNLPTIAISLMQNLSRDDQDMILNTVKTLLSEQGQELPERVKTMSLGLAIMNVVGEDILRAAIDLMNLDENRKKNAVSMFSRFVPGAANSSVEKQATKTTTLRGKPEAASFSDSGEDSAMLTGEVPDIESLVESAVAAPAESAPVESSPSDLDEKLKERLKQRLKTK